VLHFFNYKKIQPGVIVFIASCFYLYDFFLRVAPSVLTHELMFFYKIGPNILGPAMSSFFLSYSFMQIPAGLLGDHFGPRKILIISALICGFATSIFALSHNVFIGGIARFLIGFAASVAYIAPLMLASAWFDRKYFTFICGLIQVMGCIGAICGGAPVAFFSDKYGWQNTLLYSAVLGFILSLLFFFIVKDGAIKTNVQFASGKFRNYLMQVIQKKQTWYISLIGFAAWTPMAVFSELWGVPFLEVAYHIDTQVAATFIQYVWYGVAIGGPVLGLVSHKVSSRKKPMFFGLCLSLLSFYMVVYQVVNSSYLAFWLFLLGLSASVQCITFGAVLDINPKKVAGTAVGFNNMAVILGGVLCQPMVGFFLHYFWDGTKLAGVPIFNLYVYQQSFLVVPIAIVLGIVSILFFYKESFR